MASTNNIFKLQGKVQHYAWGGYEFIPQLVHFNNEENKPCAEYWMGAHPSAPSKINGADKNLLDLIKENANEFLTPNINRQFKELPFLFKVLDVRDMLSIQVHPSKTEAIKGFERENELGIPINAAHRNYKDKNHKPEVMIALGEFWLLHGFMPLKEIKKRLQNIAEFNVLQSLFKQQGLKALMQLIYEMPQADVDSILKSLMQKELANKQNGLLQKNMPGWWASKLFENGEPFENIDRGVFSIYFFNIVQVQQGEGVFQAAGVPHAYLEGQNIELMANSDNVLRGGLTPKHIDVQELMKHTIFEPVIPNILKGDYKGNFEKTYPCPVPDFKISKINIQNGEVYKALSSSPEILIVLKGGALINGENANMPIRKGDCFFVKPNQEYSIVSSGECELYKAYV